MAVPRWLAAVALAACRPGAPEACPVPLLAPQSLFVSQVFLERSPGLDAPSPDFTLTLTASGDALYAGSPRVPVRGSYMGRIGPERFATLVTELTAAGLPAPSGTQPVLEPPACRGEAVITLAFQAADGRFGRTAFCAGSESERQLALPIYRLVEQTRWQPGGPSLSIGSY